MNKPQPTDHPLKTIFDDVIHQVTKGKGGRHGGDAVPFLEQDWVHRTKIHGVGFLTGQAAKKLEEAVTTRSGDAQDQELLGALAYLGMAVLHLRLHRAQEAADQEHLATSFAPLPVSGGRGCSCACTCNRIANICICAHSCGLYGTLG